MLIRINGAAKVLDLSPSHIRKMITLGKFPAYRVGNRIIRVDPEEIRNATRLSRRAVEESQIAPPKK